MSPINQHSKPNLDDRLAEFTDEVLAGRMQQAVSGADEELLLLEETILRLGKTYPPISLDEARIKQMQVRLNNRIKRLAQDDQQPFWKTWLIRPQTRMVIGALGLLLVFLLVSPYLTAAGSSTTATAFTPAGGTIFLAFGLVVVAALLYWIIRRR